MRARGMAVPRRRLSFAPRLARLLTTLWFATSPFHATVGAQTSKRELRLWVHLSAKATNAERRLIAQSIVEQLESKVTELGPPNLNEKLCKFLMGLQVGTQRKSDSWPCVPYDEESERGCKLLLEWMLRSLEGFSDDSFIELLRGARVVHDLARVYKPLLGHTRRAKGSSVDNILDAVAMGERENESESESERGR